MLAALGVDRAYLYFFNDDDTPHLHGSSGLTRNFVPKPSFHAVAHLQQTLGNFRYSKTIREGADGSVYEFTNDAKERIWVVWKPAAPSAKLMLPLDGARIAKAVRTPLIAGDAERVEVAVFDGRAEIEAGETPLFLWLSE